MSRVAHFEPCVQPLSAGPSLRAPPPAVLPQPGCRRARGSDAGTAKGLVTKATCSRLTPEPAGGDSRWQQESWMVKQG